MVIDAQLVHAKEIWTCTKFWRSLTQTGLTSTAYNAIVTQWRRYAYCTHLLADRGASLFEFSPLESELPDADADVYYNVDLGAPSTSPVAPVKKNGVYQRGYAYGFVLVNPTATAVRLSASPDGRSYVLPGSGTAITPPITVAAYSGRILSISGHES